jgi:hypothetical protein
VKEGGGNCEGREVFGRERKEGMEDLLRERSFWLQVLVRMSRLNLGCCLEQSFLCIGSYCLTAASDESWFIIAYHESREYLHDYCPNSGSVFAQFFENFAAVSYSTGPCRYLLQWMQGQKRELGVRGQQGSEIPTLSFGSNGRLSVQSKRTLLYDSHHLQLSQAVKLQYEPSGDSG